MIGIALNLILVTICQPTTSQSSESSSEIEVSRYNRYVEQLRYGFYFNKQIKAIQPIPDEIQSIYELGRDSIRSDIETNESLIKKLRKSAYPYNTPEQRRELIKATREVLRVLRPYSDPDCLLPPPLLQYYPVLILRIGNMGRLGTSARVLQIIDDDEFIGVVYDDKFLWIKGYPTQSLHDDLCIDIGSLLVILETKTYTTVAGSTKTVPVAEIMDLSSFKNVASTKQFEDYLKQKGITPAELLEMVNEAKNHRPHYKNWAAVVVSELAIRGRR